MIGGYLIALLTAENTSLKRVVLGHCLRARRQSASCASSLLWYWLFSTDAGLVNPVFCWISHHRQRVIWLGVDEGVSTWAIIVSNA